MTQDLSGRIRIRFNHAAAKKTLAEKYQSKMLFAHAGGMWRAGPELQTMLLTCPGPEAAILDVYETPIKVDTKELYALSQQRWQEQRSAWLIEWEELQKQR